jgi:hypothetical protein
MKIIPGLIAAAVLASTPGVALADTPAPVPSNGPGQISDTPLKTSSHTITGTNGKWGLDWFDLNFDATLKSAVLQVSKKAPTQNKQGVYSMGATQPIALTGKGAGNPDPSSLVLSGQKYAFAQRVEGLEQGTTYHFLITLPVGPGFKPVQVVGSVRTEHHGVHTITRRTTGLDLDFTASGGSATVSVSKSSQIVGSKLKGSTAVVIKGTKQGDSNRFTHSFQNLTPGTKYYVLAMVNGPQTTQRLTETSTKSQQVEVTVEKIRVIDDADNGLRGKGDLLFQIRGTTAPTKSGVWGSHYGETKIGSGQTVNLKESPSAPRHTFTTKGSSFTVQVEGRESDWVGKSGREFCEENYYQPNQKHSARWLNKADSGVNCYQFSYAETAFDLKQGNVQTRTFTVARSPELRFEVTVKMTMKAA